MIRKPPICGMGPNYPVTARPLSLNILMKFLSHGGVPERPQKWNNTFSKFYSGFFGNRRRTSHAETCDEVSPFSDNVLYNLPSQFFFQSFPLLQSLPHALSSAMASNTIPLKNLNYLQAKVGRAETRKFPLIPQIGGFRSIRTCMSLFLRASR